MMATLCTQDTGTIKNEQSRDNGNIVYTRHRDNQEWTIQRWWQHCVHKTQGQSRMNNPEMMATLCTQDAGTIKNEQSRDNGNIGYTRHRGNQEWTIQRWWQYWVHKTQGQSRMNNPEIMTTLCTQDTRRRQTKQKNTTQKTNKTSNTHPTNIGLLAKGKQFLPLITHPQCSSYSQNVFNTTICKQT